MKKSCRFDNSFFSVKAAASLARPSSQTWIWRKVPKININGQVRKTPQKNISSPIQISGLRLIRIFTLLVFIINRTVPTIANPTHVAPIKRVMYALYFEKYKMGERKGQKKLFIFFIEY